MKSDARNGYVEVRKGDDIIYSGYYLNGRLFIISAPALGKAWYKGLLSEVEYENERMGNPMRYAYEKYGERYLTHLQSFTEEVLREVERRYGKEGLDVRIISMPEEHVRDILGIYEDLQQPTSVKPEEEVPSHLHEEGLSLTPENLERHLRSLNYLAHYINGKGDESLAAYLHVCEAIKHDEASFLFLYPRRIVLIGRMNGTSFVAVAPGMKVAIETLRCLYRKSPNPQVSLPKSTPVRTFVEVGVPVAKVAMLNEETLRVSILSHVGGMVILSAEVDLDVDRLISAFEEYHRWVSTVLRELPDRPPPNMTKPAWSKLIQAYLEDYPNPLDFERILNVQTVGSVELPECEGIRRILSSSKGPGGF